MKNWTSVLLVSILLFIPSFAIAAQQSDIQQVAFIRDGNLWILLNGEEKQITQSGYIHHPQWSFNGKWIMYEKTVYPSEDSGESQNEIWVYHVDSGEKKLIYHNGYEPQWAPNKDVISFLANGVLNISDLHAFHNIALGVFSYQWLPDQTGLLLSSQAHLLPDGWSNPRLYKKGLNEEWTGDDLFTNVHPFFEIPKNISVNNKSIMSISAEHFQYSPSKKWISFIVSPTASISMDSNMLCAITADGKSFQVLDEVIPGVGSPKWAPTREILAYIAGGGRIVFGFKGKNLQFKEFPVASLTPNNYAELNFTWLDDRHVVTSRVQAKEWSNEFSEHPLPKLYRINIENQSQVQITEPNAGYGDYDPFYFKGLNKIAWYRGTSITDKNRNVWIADFDGSNAKLWLKNVETVAIYDGV